MKADVGVRDSRIVAVDKAGNPDITDGVHPELVIGPSTEVLAGEGRILTAGAVDCHVHLICPQILDEALAAGITTIVGGGTGPAEGTGHHRHARRVVPGPHARGARQVAGERGTAGARPHDVGRRARPGRRSGASGYKLHEDWGTTPAAIDACLQACYRWGLQAALHTDTLNEAGFVQDTLRAIGGRSIHSYHTEGAGGGHAPDIITVASFANIIPSSTNPTRPHTVNTIDEHLDMLMVCHHLNPRVPEDLAFAESRIRPSTIVAEDWLHDMGAISIIGSDSQAMGRVGEVITRTFQTAHVMKDRRGALDGEPVAGADNVRARRYIAKVTICPAQAHGLEGEVGSIERVATGRCSGTPESRDPQAPCGRHLPAAGTIPANLRRFAGIVPKLCGTGWARWWAAVGPRLVRTSGARVDRPGPAPEVRHDPPRWFAAAVAPHAPSRPVRPLSPALGRAPLPPSPARQPAPHARSGARPPGRGDGRVAPAPACPSERSGRSP